MREQIFVLRLAAAIFVFFFFSFLFLFRVQIVCLMAVLTPNHKFCNNSVECDDVKNYKYTQAKFNQTQSALNFFVAAAVVSSPGRRQLIFIIVLSDSALHHTHTLFIYF